MQLVFEKRSAISENENGTGDTANTQTVYVLLQSELEKAAV